MTETKDFQIADSGQRETHDGGAVRDVREGKGRFDLVTPIAERRLAKWYELGARKYADRNWEKGMPLSRFLDSALRHLNAYKTIAQLERDGLAPDFIDGVDPNEDHLAAAAWNILAMMHFEQLRPDLDDLHGEPEPIEAPNAETAGLKFLQRLVSGYTNAQNA